MKVVMKYDKLRHRHYWVLLHSNGYFIAESRYYKHKSSAKRGFNKFSENLSTVCLHNMEVI